MLQHLYAFSVTDFASCFRGYNLVGVEGIVENAYKTAKKYHDPIIEDRIQEWRNGKRHIRKICLIFSYPSETQTTMTY
jgi:phenylalanine N-monooxygenase